MNFGETLYGMMYELLSPFGMEDLAYVRQAWDHFPFGDLTEADKAGIQKAFGRKLEEIVAYLGENGLTIADLMENRKWKSGNEDFIGLLSQLAKSIGCTYDSTAGALVFSTDGRTIDGPFPFVAVEAAAVATDKTYLVSGSTLSAIGDAIRAKEGSTEKYGPATMAQKITDDLVKPSGTLQIKSAQQVDVRSYQYAKVTDANLTAGNIKKDVTILGIKGTHEGGGGGKGGDYNIVQTNNGDNCSLAITDANTFVLTTKTISENGTYNASADNADGYSQVTVNVASGGGGGYSFTFPATATNFPRVTKLIFADGTSQVFYDFPSSLAGQTFHNVIMWGWASQNYGYPVYDVSFTGKMISYSMYKNSFILQNNFSKLDYLEAPVAFYICEDIVMTKFSERNDD